MAESNGLARGRYVLTGEWGGYSMAQAKIVHREVVPYARAKRLQSLHTIEYNDGTKLYLHMRKAAPRERVSELLGYRNLIREAETMGAGFVRAIDLPSTKASQARAAIALATSAAAAPATTEG